MEKYQVACDGVRTGGFVTRHSCWDTRLRTQVIVDVQGDSEKERGTLVGNIPPQQPQTTQRVARGLPLGHTFINANPTPAAQAAGAPSSDEGSGFNGCGFRK